jgi:hypothetical protein
MTVEWAKEYVVNRKELDGVGSGDEEEEEFASGRENEEGLEEVIELGSGEE